MRQSNLNLYLLTLHLIFKYTIYQETLFTDSELFLIIALGKGPLIILISVSFILSVGRLKMREV